MKPRFLFLTFFLVFYSFFLPPTPSSAADTPPNPSDGACSQNLEEQISEFFDQGASGYLLWQYSGNRKINPLENDRYSFFKDSPVCTALSQLKDKFPDKFLGVNVHSLARHDENTIREHLSYLSSSCGTSVIRIWGTPDRASPEKLKSLLNIAQNHNIKVIIALADYSNSSGNILPGNIRGNPTSWYQSGYQQYYLPHVQQVVSTIGNHPALYGYELANEPHCGGQPDCPPAYNQWAANVSSAIKSINSSTKVGIGQMASQPTTLGDSPQNGNFTDSNAATNITITSAHFYNDSEKTSALSALQQAKNLGKPFYIGEAPSTCLETPDCSLESLNIPPININKADPSLPGEALHPLNKHPDNYAPNQEYVTVCEYETNIEQDYPSHKNPETGEVEPYTATEIRQNIEENKFASNFTRLISTFFKPITNLFAPKQQISQSFTSYGDEYISAGYKMTPANQQNQFKNELITKAKNGTVLNEQIAWGCSNGCFSLNCDKPNDSCQPVYLSQDNHPCHQKAYKYLNFTRSGSSNSKVKVTDDEKETTQDRMLPAGAVLTEQNVPMQAISSNQKMASNVICKTVPRPPTQDTTNPIKFNLLRFILELINRKKTVKAPVEVEEKLDPELQEGLNTQKTFIRNFIPAKHGQESIDEPDSGAAGKIPLKSPGGGQTEDDFIDFANYLHPASWQNNL